MAEVEQDLPVIIDQDPPNFVIETEDPYKPYDALWWSGKSVSGVPEQVMGWLVAQGWEITGIASDSSTVPPTPYYSLSKQSLAPQSVLLTLTNSYMDAAIKAQSANEFRYNSIVNSWTILIESTHMAFQDQVTQQNNTTAIFLTGLDEFMEDLDDGMDTYLLALNQGLETIHGVLAEMDTKLADLESNANANATTVDSLLTAQAGYLSDFITGLTDKLAELDTNYDAHLALIQALITDVDTDETTFIASQATELDALSDEYDTHVDTATQFLVDLGSTEEARITEEFAASLSNQIQDLISKGLYTSILAADFTARNTRDRDEQIQSLKDRLAREKLENEHQLYGQQTNIRTRRLEEASRLQQISLAVNTWKASHLDNLLAQIQDIDLKQAQGIEAEHAAQQDVSRIAMAERDALLGQLQTAVNGILAGKERYAAALSKDAFTLADAKHRIIQEKMNTATAQLDGWKEVAEQNRQLMAYQLDERNKLMVGLYSFVERREDVAPEWKDMASTVAGLGDAGGGWITP